ncbi:MAG TPA: 4Fe-4S binding protein [Deltaproteobacteria bacterium]|nr:4Fe-4S binding protein [Deltaproteobacteria bacterium]HPJ93190.1 4Fe-4S binding protein [Deltaproteobacteria bacterium]HPR50854.1 4Fe-4S binding protein [Deltaproteobacteria bacterium]
MNGDPYEKILNTMREYPTGIPSNDGEVSEAFRAYIKLLFTPEEALIAAHLGIKPVSGGRIAQKIGLRLANVRFIQKIAKKVSAAKIARKIGKDRKETLEILEAMVDKGVIQDIGGYSHFLTVPHLLNIGFKYPKALERLGVKGAELYQQFFIQEKYYRRYQSSDAGTPMTRIVPIEKSIDHRSTIRSSEEIHRILDQCPEPIVTTDCPCRNRTDILGIRECRDKYPIHDSCFQIGAFGEYFLRRGQGRKLKREEAHQLVERYAQLGLVFTTENTKDRNRFIICCCCECCCALLRGMTRFVDKNDAFSAKANYVAEVDPTLCKGCTLCVERCKFHAITVENKRASVNLERCYGCGVCAVTCPSQAVKLHRAERSALYVDAIDLTDTIYSENKP